MSDGDIDICIERGRAASALRVCDLLAKIHRRHIERALADAHLPPWPELMRGIPNGILRTALFGAIKRRKRRYMEREPIASVEGVYVTHTGPRLDQSDLDVFAGALHLARPVELGDSIACTEKGFLRLIGRGGSNGNNIGKSNRLWLKKVLARLKATAVEITQGPHTYCGSLINDYVRDSSNGCNVLILNSRLKVLFNHGGWTSIDWSIRRALIGHPVAQWLHGFHSTHAVPVPYKAETLHFLCGSEAGKNAQTGAERHKALLDWIGDSLVPAFKALKHISDEAGQPFSWEISLDGLVSVSRTWSASQLKHLRLKAVAREGRWPVIVTLRRVEASLDLGIERYRTRSLGGAQSPTPGGRLRGTRGQITRKGGTESELSTGTIVAGL